MKQKYHKKIQITKNAIFSCQLLFLIYVAECTDGMVLKCHIRNLFASFIWFRVTNFSQHTIKTP